MKIKILPLLLLFFTSYSYSQVDKKSENILKGLSNKYKSFKSIKADFSIIVENAKDKSKETQKGVLLLKGQKYKLQIVGQEIISDGKTRWTFLKDANEIQIDNLKVDESAITPTNIFTIYEKGWLSKFISEQKEKNVMCQTVELIPSETKSKNVFKVRLTINKSQKTIVAAKIFDKNGTIQTILVDKFLPDGASNDSNFIFNKDNYPGSEIVDLR